MNNKTKTSIGGTVAVAVLAIAAYLGITSGQPAAPAHLSRTLSTHIYNSADTPLDIPDCSTAGITSTITVPLSQYVQAITVSLNITHTFDGDLIITLFDPTGGATILVQSVGADGDNFTNTVLGNGAATSINDGTAPFTGIYQPQDPLSNGMNSSGNWKLRLEDGYCSDVGTLLDWTLILDTDTSPPPTPTPTITPTSLPLANASSLKIYRGSYHHNGNFGFDDGGQGYLAADCSFIPADMTYAGNMVAGIHISEMVTAHDEPGVEDATFWVCNDGPYYGATLSVNIVADAAGGNPGSGVSVPQFNKLGFGNIIPATAFTTTYNGPTSCGGTGHAYWFEQSHAGAEGSYTAPANYWVDTATFPWEIQGYADFFASQEDCPSPVGDYAHVSIDISVVSLDAPPGWGGTDTPTPTITPTITLTPTPAPTLFVTPDANGVQCNWFIDRKDKWVSDAAPVTTPAPTSDMHLQLNTRNYASIERSFMGFDLSGIPAWSTIITAELQMPVVSAGAITGTVWSYYVMTNTWTEAITFTNAPALGTPIASKAIGPGNYMEPTPSFGGYEHPVETVIASDGLISAAVAQPSSGGSENRVVFQGRRGATAPDLYVCWNSTYVSPPTHTPTPTATATPTATPNPTPDTWIDEVFPLQATPERDYNLRSRAGINDEYVEVYKYVPGSLAGYQLWVSADCQYTFKGGISPAGAKVIWEDMMANPQGTPCPGFVMPSTVLITNSFGIPGRPYIVPGATPGLSYGFPVPSDRDGTPVWQTPSPGN